MVGSADSGDRSDIFAAARSTADDLIGGSSAAVSRWIDNGLRAAVSLSQTLDSATVAAGNGLSQTVSAASEALRSAKDSMDWAKGEYATAEELAIGKVKEGIVVAASHPVLSCGVAAGMGLVLLKRPRNYLIQSTRRIFLSKESLISNLEANVKELEQSVNLVKNESKKLQDRASKAEEEIKIARVKILDQGRDIVGGLRHASRLERQIIDLKHLMEELPKREVSSIKPEVSAIVSKVKKEKKVLNGALSKIINHGIPL